MHANVEVVDPPELAIGPGRPRAPVLRSPVRISWKPVRGAQKYRVVLKLPGTETEDPYDQVTETTEPTWTAELPSEPDWAYLAVIEAHGARAELGSTFVQFAIEDGADATLPR